MSAVRFIHGGNLPIYLLRVIAAFSWAPMREM